MVVGIAMAQILSLLLLRIPDWRILLGWPALLALAQLFSVPLIPESPRYLLRKLRVSEARSALSRLRSSESRVDDELRTYVADHGKSEETVIAQGLDVDHDRAIMHTEVAPFKKAVSLWTLLTKTKFRKQMIILMALVISQQLSGINGIVRINTTNCKSCWVV